MGVEKVQVRKRGGGGGGGGGSDAEHLRRRRARRRRSSGRSGACSCRTKREGSGVESSEERGGGCVAKGGARCGQEQASAMTR